MGGMGRQVLVQILSWVASAAKVSWILFNLKFYCLVVCLLLILDTKLPYGVVLALIFGRGYFSVQVVFAVFWSVILVCKLDHAISVGPGRYRQVWPSWIIGSLVHLLSSVDILGKLTAKFLASGLLAVLLLIIHLLIGHLIIIRTDCLLNNHSGRVAAAITFLPQSCGIHLASSSTRINRVFLNDLVDAIVVAALDHSAVLRSHVLSCSTELFFELLQTSEIWIFGSNQLGLHGVSHRLVTVVSNRSRILDAVRHNGPDSALIHACLRSHKIQGTRQVQVTAKVIQLRRFLGVLDLWRILYIFWRNSLSV